MNRRDNEYHLVLIKWCFFSNMRTNECTWEKQYHPRWNNAGRWQICQTVRTWHTPYILLLMSWCMSLKRNYTTMWNITFFVNHLPPDRKNFLIDCFVLMFCLFWTYIWNIQWKWLLYVRILCGLLLCDCHHTCKKYTQRIVQPDQSYFTVQITSSNFECSL